MKEWIKPIADLKACTDALKWAEQFDSLDEAWAVCERGDWMLWLAGRLSGGPRSKSRKILVLAACECARLALPFGVQGESRPLIAIETAEARARDKKGVTLKDVRAAAYAAYAAADAAHAAHAAAYAAYAAHAAHAAAYAAYAAVYAADAAAREPTLAHCADIVRKHYPKAPKLPRNNGI